MADAPWVRALSRPPVRSDGGRESLYSRVRTLKATMAATAAASMARSVRALCSRRGEMHVFPDPHVNSAQGRAIASPGGGGHSKHWAGELGRREACKSISWIRSPHLFSP